VMWTCVATGWAAIQFGRMLGIKMICNHVGGIAITRSKCHIVGARMFRRVSRQSDARYGSGGAGLSQKSEADKWSNDIFRHRNTLRQQLAVMCACWQPDSAVLRE